MNKIVPGVLISGSDDISDDKKSEYYTLIGSGTKNGALVAQTESIGANYHRTKLTFTNFLLTLTANGTTSAGGGTKIYDFPQGLILPIGGTSNLTLTNTGDGSFLMSLGSAAADTGGTLTSTEITFAPSTAATIASGVGTCKMKSTVLAPVPGTPLDGTTSAAALYLNGCLNADGTGKLTLTVNGTITYLWADLGDN